MVNPHFGMGQPMAIRTSSERAAPGSPLRADRGERVAVRVAVRASRASRCPEADGELILVGFLTMGDHEFP